MDAAAIREMALLEETNWWYQARRELITNILRLEQRTFYVALDLGCGVGSAIAALRPFAKKVIGLDPSPTARALAAGRGYAECLTGTAGQIPLGDASVELVLCADVLEHLADDLAALREIRRVLTTNGRLLLTVPAHRWLWNRNDDFCGHLRRYSRQGLTRRLNQAGFRAIRLEWWNFSLLVPFWIFALWERRFRPNGPERNNLAAIPPWLNGVALGLMRLERLMSRLVPLPIGASLLALAAPAASEDANQN